MLPYIDLPRALSAAATWAIWQWWKTSASPSMCPLISLAKKHWTDIQDDLIAEIDADYGVYDGRTFKEERFEAYLEREDIPIWPRLESGRLDLDDSKRHVFREMAKMLSDHLADERVAACAFDHAALQRFADRRGRQEPRHAQRIRLENRTQPTVATPSSFSAPARGSAGSSSRRPGMASLTSTGQPGDRHRRRPVWRQEYDGRLCRR